MIHCQGWTRCHPNKTRVPTARQRGDWLAGGKPSLPAVLQQRGEVGKTERLLRLQGEALRAGGPSRGPRTASGCSRALRGPHHIPFPTGRASWPGQAGGEAAVHTVPARAAPAPTESASPAVRNALCSLPRSPGRALQAECVRALCSHLGPSFPIYLVVSLNPSPHTTDIFLI